METVSVIAEPEGEEKLSSCPCCGRPIFSGCGTLKAEGVAIADDWYRWPEGHQGQFSLALASRNSGGEPVDDGGVVAIAVRLDGEKIIYTVQEPEEAPWSDFGAYGKLVSRALALREAPVRNLFHIAGAVSANERRISTRVLSSGLQA
ncbi:MAG: hypothetical protein ACPHN2_16985 [Sinimarinibacterium flocculans]|uniref:hypothetical protein n=1 Tax=Sinimarinibacterium flocculans TaxID=985250 RepID=UPI003C324B08